MLQAISDRAQGLFASIIIGLLIIPFALWGVQEYFGFGQDATFAEVNDVEIPLYEFQRRFQMERQRMQSMFGKGGLPAAFDDSFIKNNVSVAMINEEVLYQAVQEAGLRASDQQLRAQIQSTSAFQADGQFSVKVYEEQLRYAGMTTQGFEHMLRRSIPVQQFQAGISDTAIVTKANIKDKLRLQDQEREVAYLKVPAERFADQVSVSEAEINQHFEQNKSRYATDETVTIEYISLDGKQMREAMNPDDELLQTRYQERVEEGEFTQAGGREASHILIEVAQDAGPEAKDAANEKIAEIQQRLQAGEAFSELAKQFSQDPGSAEQGGSLGEVKRDQMVKPFEEVLFAMEEGQISDPVTTRFGIHIIKLHKIIPDDTKPFADVRDQLVREYKDEQMEQIFYDQLQQLTDISYENPDSLLPAAQALGVEIQTLKKLTRSGVGEQGIGANPKVAAKAFSLDVLEVGNNSEPIEIDSEHVVVLRVLDHQKSEPKPLAEVRATIEETLRAQKTREAARTLAEKVQEEIQAGTALDAVAQTHELSLESLGMIRRDDKKAPANIVESAFSLSKPADGEVKTSLVPLQDDYAVLALTKVVEALKEDLPEAVTVGVKRDLKRTFGSAQFQAMVEAFKQQAEIQLNPEEL